MHSVVAIVRWRTYTRIWTLYAGTSAREPNTIPSCPLRARTANFNNAIEREPVQIFHYFALPKLQQPHDLCAAVARTHTHIHSHSRYANLAP